jgi:MscS family membrane protein
MDWSSIVSTLSSSVNNWVIQVFAVVLLALIVDFVLKLFLKRMHTRLEQTSNLWDDAFIEAIQRPLTALVWIVGIAFAAHIVERQTNAPIFAAVTPLRDIGVISVVAWFVIRLISRIEENILSAWQAEGKHIDRTTADAITRLLRFAVIITAMLVGLQTLGFSISGVLAFGGIGGIAIGFAAKDLLSNFFGGLMLYLDRPFSIGDWIRSPDRNIEGTVEVIGWRLTQIRTFDKRPVYIPNSVFSTIAVENPSRMSHRRIKETIGVRYDDADKMEAILAETRAFLLADADIDTTQTLMVNFNKFSDSSLDFFIYCFTHTTVWTEYHQIKERVLLKIYAIIVAHGAEVAFPTSTVHVPDGVRIESEGVKS